MTVHAVQVNFADDHIDIPSPGPIRPGSQARYIDEDDRRTQWKLEGSLDGESWFIVEDKSDAQTDLSHDLIVREEGFAVRYLRLSDMAVPFEQKPCVSGLRVFGLCHGEKPHTPVFTAARQGNLDMLVDVAPQVDALGYNILFGSSPEKLYHSYITFTPGETRVSAIIKDREYYVRVDAFNESGITHGICIKLK